MTAEEEEGVVSYARAALEGGNAPLARHLLEHHLEREPDDAAARALLDEVNETEGVEAETEDPATVARRNLRCLVCDHTGFEVRTAQLNTPVAAFFGLERANRSAECHVCRRCGYVHWFL